MVYGFAKTIFVMRFSFELMVTLTVTAVVLVT